MNALRIHALDWIVNLFLIFPAVICYWRGIWDLYGYYIYQGQEPLNHWVITGVGSAFILAYYVYPLLDRCMNKLPPVIRDILTRLTLYTWGLLSMAYWKGVWELLDFYLFQYGWKGGAIGLAVCYPILVLTGASRTIIFTPFAVDVDWRKGALDSSTAFGFQLKKDFRNFTVYTLDSLFTHFFINTISIVCWRSILTMISEIPFPDGTEDFIFLAIGIFSTLLLFLLEIPLALIGKTLIPCSVNESSSRELDENGAPDKTKTGEKMPENPVDAKTQKISSQTWRTCVSILWTRESGKHSVDEIMKGDSGKASGKTDSSEATFHREDKNGQNSQAKKSHLSAFDLPSLKSRLYEQTIFLLVFISEGFLWEGAWNLNSTYVISDLRVGGWVNHLLGTFLLFQMGLTSDAGSCGCVKDASTLGGFGTKGTPHLYPNKFIRLIVEEAVEDELNSQEKRQITAAVASLATVAANVDSASPSIDSTAALTTADAVFRY